MKRERTADVVAKGKKGAASGKLSAKSQ